MTDSSIEQELALAKRAAGRHARELARSRRIPVDVVSERCDRWLRSGVGELHGLRHAMLGPIADFVQVSLRTGRAGDLVPS